MQWGPGAQEIRGQWGPPAAGSSAVCDVVSSHMFKALSNLPGWAPDAGVRIPGSHALRGGGHSAGEGAAAAGGDAHPGPRGPRLLGIVDHHPLQVPTAAQPHSAGATASASSGNKPKHICHMHIIRINCYHLETRSRGSETSMWLWGPS